MWETVTALSGVTYNNNESSMAFGKDIVSVGDSRPDDSQKWLY